MTGAPPFAGPAIQLKVIEVAALADTISATFRGASGAVRMIAPFPTADSSE
jgi:hypothetical protein